MVHLPKLKYETIHFFQLPCRKDKSEKRRNTEKQLCAVPGVTNDTSTKTPSEDVFSSIPDLQAISPATSFKSLDMTASSVYLNNSFASMYWSYPSLAGRSLGPSLATSTASFKTALEQIDDDDDDDENDYDLSFSSIPTGKRDLNALTDCNYDVKDTKSKNKETVVERQQRISVLLHSMGTRTKDEPVWVQKPEFKNLTPNKNSAQILSSQSVPKETKSNGTPIGIKRFQKGHKSVITGDDKAKRTSKVVVSDKSTKDT